MFSKTIKYTDFNGQPQEKVFWFHLSNAKLAMLSSDNGLKTWVDQMAKEQDPAQILDKIRYLIQLSCGIRSEDGQRFIQTEQAQSELLDSSAFDELLFELFVGDNASKFFTALVPPEQQKQIEELAKKQAAVDPFKEPAQVLAKHVKETTGLDIEDGRPAYQKENRKPTPAEMREMNKEEMQEAWSWTVNNGLA